MAVSYNRLYKVLEDKNVTMVELRKAADIAPNTMTRIRKNEEVSLDVLGRICHVLTSFITEKVNPQLGLNILALRNHDSGVVETTIRNRANVKPRAALRGVSRLYIGEISCILHTCQSVS